MIDHRSLRTGAVLLIAAGVLNVASNTVQPQISDYTDTAEVFAAIASAPLWEISRIGVLFAGMLGAGGVLLFARSLRGERGGIPALFSAASAHVGAAVVAVMMGFDLAQHQMAKMTLNVQPEHSAAALWAGHALHTASFAVFTISLIVFGGVTPILLGLALIIGHGYPKWIGWLSIGSGSGVLIAAVFQAISGPVPVAIGIMIPLFGLLSTISTLALGGSMWRRGSS